MVIKGEYETIDIQSYIHIDSNLKDRLSNDDIKEMLSREMIKNIKHYIFINDSSLYCNGKYQIKGTLKVAKKREINHRGERYV